MVSKTGRRAQGTMFDDTPMGILEMLLIGGGIVAGLSFAPALLAALGGLGYAMRSEDRQRFKKIQTSFSYLKQKGYVSVKQQARDEQAFVLTSKGRRRAQLLFLRQRIAKMKRPPRWDRKWRMILFDIPAGERMKRNAFRSLIRRLGAVMLQKSVWIYPFDCSEEVILLREFFRLSERELRLVIANDIGTDRALRKHFKI